MVLTLSLAGCRHPERTIDASFYYWRPEFALTAGERGLLDSLRCTKLYVKFFDVDRDKVSGRPHPVAQIHFIDSSYRDREIVPVVYITTAAIASVRGSSAEALADSIGQLVNSICQNHAIKYHELQIDCDWAAGSRDRYFRLLAQIRHSLPAHCILSCTIRLHQVKYKVKTGIPPVDRGMLMYYNMGKPDDIKEQNSIYDPANAGRYASYAKDYPLPLDVALPVFSWGVLFRDGRAKELLDGFDKKALDEVRHVRKRDAIWYEVDSSFYIRGKYLKARDLIRIEEISPYICREAAGQLSPYLKTQHFTLTFFDLSPQTTTRYETRDFQEILDILR